MRYISDIIAYGHGVKSNLDIDNVLVKLKMTGASIIGNNSFVVIYEQKETTMHTSLQVAPVKQLRIYRGG